MWFFNRSVKFTELDFRTDIHSHILPGVDDGFRTEDRSARALELLHGMGLERSVLTPHIYPELYPGNTPVSVRLRLEEVSGLFSSTGVDCRAAGEQAIFFHHKIIFHCDFFNPDGTEREEYVAVFSGSGLICRAKLRGRDGAVGCAWFS